jgi:hypothetical protein
MFTSSQYLIGGTSTRCSFCNKPLNSRDGYIEFWRASNGAHFCSEFCADDAEEAQFLKHRAVQSLAVPTVTSSTAVRAENLIRLDLVTESLTVSGDGGIPSFLAEPAWLAVQVQELPCG